MAETTESLCEVCDTSLEGKRGDRFCSRECYNLSQRDRLKVQCEVCGETEEVTATRAEYYRTCSRECLNVVQSDEFSGEQNPNHRNDVDTDDLVADYRGGASTVVLAKRYGMTDVGVGHRLREAGVDLDDPGYPKTVETDRGEMVRSYYEREVANWLNRQGVDYEYEPNGFPGPYLPDFVVDGDVIEVWGFSSSEYEARRGMKERWYAQHNIACHGIEPDDIGDLENTLNI